jgi:PAT family acetyl-CoA transporter-like MFS transporter 1
MCIFLALNCLAATQDIAVDGWALTMLSRKNVGYASTYVFMFVFCFTQFILRFLHLIRCNVVGLNVGYTLGSVVFLTLQSKHFANTWIRAVPGDNGLVEFDGNINFSISKN